MAQQGDTPRGESGADAPPRSDGRGGRVRTDGGDRTADASVRVDPGEASEWTVDANVLGKFTEMNGREAYPGIYSEHLANGSFEEWYTRPKRTPAGNPRWWQRTEVAFRDVEFAHGVAYPWEPLDAGGRVAFEHPVGGVHGREPGSGGDDTHGRPYCEPEPRYQRVTVTEGAGGVTQRVALPDRRTREYAVAFSVRGDGCGDEVTVRLDGPDGDARAARTVAFGDEWERHEVALELTGESDVRYRESPFGVHALTFAVEGAGHVDLDWVTLTAGDAVAGKFNPTTVENLREYGVPTIRWPGGNFTSQYHWRDGVGPVEDRPVRSEFHWGGLEPNYLGTNEFLEFCDHAGVEPLLNVGFTDLVGPEDAGAWVEYVNGDPEETEMGALRAEHGYEAPWGVEKWEVGNEVYGAYQIGHVDAETYARAYREYHDAMKAADPDIEIVATGLDPGYVDWGGNEWNETLFDVAGDRVEGVDIHRYVPGAMEEDYPEAWDAIEYNQQLVAFPTQFEALVAELRESAAERGFDDLIVNVGEWNLQPNVEAGEPRAAYGTMAHAAFTAGMYNAFLRQGDAVRLAYMRDNSFKFRPYPADLRPMGTANNRAMKLYADVLGDGREWHHLPADVDSPTFDTARNGVRIRATPDVPFVDVSAVRSADGAVAAFATNRNVRDGYDVRFEFAGASGADVSAVVQRAEDPFDDRTDWDGGTSYEVEESTLTADDDGAVTLRLPPAAIARLSVPADEVGGER